MNRIVMKRAGALFNTPCPFGKCLGTLIVIPFGMRYKCTICKEKGSLLGPKITDENISNPQCKWIMIADEKPPRRILMEKKAIVKKQGSVYLGQCPFHKKKAKQKTQSLSLTVRENMTFYCNECGARGTVRIPNQANIILEKTKQEHDRLQEEAQKLSDLLGQEVAKFFTLERTILKNSDFLPLEEYENDEEDDDFITEF